MPRPETAAASPTNVRDSRAFWALTPNVRSRREAWRIGPVSNGVLAAKSNSDRTCSLAASPDLSRALNWSWAVSSVEFIPMTAFLAAASVPVTPRNPTIAAENASAPLTRPPNARETFCDCRSKSRPNCCWPRAASSNPRFHSAMSRRSFATSSPTLTSPATRLALSPVPTHLLGEDLRHAVLAHQLLHQVRDPRRLLQHPGRGRHARHQPGEAPHLALVPALAPDRHRHQLGGREARKLARLEAELLVRQRLGLLVPDRHLYSAAALSPAPPPPYPAPPKAPLTRPRTSLSAPRPLSTYSVSSRSTSSNRSRLSSDRSPA